MDVEAVGGVAQSVEAPAFLSGRSLVQVQLPSTPSLFCSLGVLVFWCFGLLVF